MKIIMDPRRVVALALAAALAGGCAYITKAEREPAPEPAPVLIEGRDAEFRETCAALYLQELERPIDPDGEVACVDLARRGYTAETLAEWLRSSPEHTALLERKDREAREAEERRKREEEERERNKPRLRGRLRAEGTALVDAAGERYIPAFASALTILTKTPAERAAVLDELAGLGFNGIRVFAGALLWAPQTPAQALAALPDVLRETAARGLYVQVTAITDSRDGGYDVRAHLAAVADLTAGFEHTILESGNELYHGTQADVVNDIQAFCEMSRATLAGYPNLWGLGAGNHDEPIAGRYDAACGPLNFVHLRRGQPAHMLDALHGLAAIARDTGRPVLNSEPIGAAEVSRPGARLADPAWFGEMAHRGVSLGLGAVFHSEDGLHARPLSPLQLEAARAFIEGMRRAPADVPPPPAPIPEPPAASPWEVIQRVAARGGLSKCGLGDDPASNRGCGIFTRLVVQELHAAGFSQFGLLTKLPHENNYEGFAVDAIIDRSLPLDGHCVYDIIARGGAAPEASFQGPEGRRAHSVYAPPVPLSAADLLYVGWTGR